MNSQGAMKGTEFARRMPWLPTFSNAAEGQSGLVVERYRQASTTEIDIPPERDHRLALHLSGTTLVEQHDPNHKRQWSDVGHLFLNPGGSGKRCSFKGRPDFLMLHISPELVSEAAANSFDVDPARVSLLRQFAVPDPTVEQLGRLIMVEAEAGAVSSHVLVDILARALAVHLLRRYSSIAPARPDQPAPMVGWRLRQVVEFMKANLAENISLPQLASVAGLGSSQFAHAFRTAMGQPPYRYLVHLRIEHARELLEQTTLPVIDIGMRCGFEQPNHFTTMFGKVTGMSPRAYRKARCT